MFDYITCLGNPNDVNIASGTPYYFLKHGKKEGLISDYVCLTDRSYFPSAKRLIWNFFAAVGGKAGGYQYSDYFLESLWKEVHLEKNASLINCFQMYPNSINRRSDLLKYFYIDMTLMQLFDFYGSGVISKRRKNQILDKEASGYRLAKHIYCHSEWCKSSLVQDYGISSDEITPIVPGANFDSRVPTVCEDNVVDSSFKIITIGREFHRKGIDRLLDSVSLLNSQGYNISVTVIGIKKTDIPDCYRPRAWIHWIESIDKGSHEEEFLRCVASHDLGVLLSRAEAGGMVMREYHFCSLPTIHTLVGGAPEHSICPATVGVDLESEPAQIAAIIRRFIDDSEFYTYMKEQAGYLAHQSTWESTISVFKNAKPE